MKMSDSLHRSSKTNQFKNVSAIDILKIYGYILKLSIKKTKRDYSRIDQEYNSGLWNKKFEEIDFESLYGNYARKELNEDVIMTSGGKLIKGKWHDVEAKIMAEFLKVFEKYKEDSIVELGCGLGINLFMLRKAGFRKLEGYDLSKNAVERLRQYSKIKGYDIHFDECDLNKPFSEDMIKNKIVFTKVCLEQCKHTMSNVLKNIVDGKPKLVINFEVDYDHQPLMVRKYTDACDYQNNLVQELKELEKESRIEILSISKLPYSLSPVKRLSCIIWKPT